MEKQNITELPLDDSEVKATIELDRLIAEQTEKDNSKNELLDLGDAGELGNRSQFLGLNICDIEKHILLNSKDFNTIFQFFDLSYGCFGVVLNQPIHLSLQGELIKTVLNTSLSNFNVVGLRKDIAVVEPGDRCFIGCNRSFLLEDGLLNVPAIMSEMTRNSPDKFFYPRDVSEYLTHSSPYDSHVYYIYNMLTTWLYAVIHERTPDSKYTYIKGNCIMQVELRKPFYEDEHCIIDYGPKASEQIITVPVPFGFYEPDKDAHSVHFDERDRLNYFNKPHTIRLPNDTHGYQLTFYLSHVFEREPYYPWVNFDIGFHPIIRNYLVDFVGIAKGKGQGRLETVLPICEPIPSDVLLEWIQEYVKANNLIHDYSLALEILLRAAFWPIPETQEGNVWTQTAKIQIAMPDFYPLRGTFPPLFYGDPYIPPGIVQYRIRDQKTLFNYLCLCAIENYLMIYGLQLQIYVRVHYTKSWYAACRATDDEFSLFGVWDTYGKCFQAIFNCTFLTNMNRHGYISLIFRFKDFKGVSRVRTKPKNQAIMDEINKRRRRLYLNEKDDYYGQRHKVVVESLTEPLGLIEFKNIITEPKSAEVFAKHYTGLAMPVSKKELSVDMLEIHYNNYLANFKKREPKDWFFISILPAWVTGGLLDGSVITTSVYSCILKPSWSFKPNRIAMWDSTPLNYEEALTLTQTARYFNRDIQWYDKAIRDYKSHPIKPWANVRQRIIEPSFLLFNCSSLMIYYGGDITGWLRKEMDVFRDIWALYQDGFELHKTRGTYYQSKYLSRMEVTNIVRNVNPIIPTEASLIVHFEVANVRSRPQEYIEDKDIEEPSMIQHFQSPGAKKNDPSMMLPGIKRKKRENSQKKL